MKTLLRKEIMIFSSRMKYFILFIVGITFLFIYLSINRNDSVPSYFSIGYFSMPILLGFCILYYSIDDERKSKSLEKYYSFYSVLYVSLAKYIFAVAIAIIFIFFYTITFVLALRVLQGTVLCLYELLPNIINSLILVICCSWLTTVVMLATKGPFLVSVVGMLPLVLGMRPDLIPLFIVLIFLTSALVQTYLSKAVRMGKML